MFMNVKSGHCFNNRSICISHPSISISKACISSHSSLNISQSPWLRQATTSIIVNTTVIAFVNYIYFLVDTLFFIFYNCEP